MWLQYLHINIHEINGKSRDAICIQITMNTLILKFCDGKQCVVIIEADLIHD